MMERDKDIWKALDRIFFGMNDPARVREEIKKLEGELAHQRSSLGRFLRSLRRSHKRSLSEMSRKAGVTAGLWKAWEYDFETPSREELEEVATRLKWSRLQREKLWELWGQAARFRLRRFTTLGGEYLAAKRVATDADIAWTSVDEVSRERVIAWGREHGYDFPRDLADFLSSLKREEEREAWVDQILGGTGTV